MKLVRSVHNRWGISFLYGLLQLFFGLRIDAVGDRAVCVGKESAQNSNYSFNAAAYLA
jgi:hypothetical protein